MTTFQMQNTLHFDPDDAMELSGDANRQADPEDDIDLDIDVQHYQDEEDATMSDDGNPSGMRVVHGNDVADFANDDEMADDDYHEGELDIETQAEDEIIEDAEAEIQDDVDVLAESDQEETRGGQQPEPLEAYSTSENVPVEEQISQVNGDLKEYQKNEDHTRDRQTAIPIKEPDPLPQAQEKVTGHSDNLDTSPYNPDEPAYQPEVSQDTVDELIAIKSTYEAQEISDDLLVAQEQQISDTYQKSQADLDSAQKVSKVTGETKQVHPIIVNYQGSEMSLFPPVHEGQKHSETFFLQDEQLAWESMASVLNACRSVLAESVGNQDELVISIDDLGLHIAEFSADASQMTLIQILDIYIELQSGDGITEPPPLYTSLYANSRPLVRLSYLRDILGEGKGLSAVMPQESTADDNQEHAEETAASKESEVDDKNADAASKVSSGEDKNIEEEIQKAPSRQATDVITDNGHHLSPAAHSSGKDSQMVGYSRGNDPEHLDETAAELTDQDHSKMHDEVGKEESDAHLRADTIADKAQLPDELPPLGAPQISKEAVKEQQNKEDEAQGEASGEHDGGEDADDLGFEDEPTDLGQGSSTESSTLHGDTVKAGSARFGTPKEGLDEPQSPNQANHGERLSVEATKDTEHLDQGPSYQLENDGDESRETQRQSLVTKDAVDFDKARDVQTDHFSTTTTGEWQQPSTDADFEKLVHSEDLTSGVHYDESELFNEGDYSQEQDSEGHNVLGPDEGHQTSTLDWDGAQPDSGYQISENANQQGIGDQEDYNEQISDEALNSATVAGSEDEGDEITYQDEDNTLEDPIQTNVETTSPGSLKRLRSHSDLDETETDPAQGPKKIRAS